MKLTPEQINTLCVKVQNGCNRSLEVMLKAYEKLILSRISKQFKRHDTMYKEDLYQEACIAFIKGCRKYDTTLEASFVTYVIYRIDTALCRFQSRPIKTPQSHIEMEKNYYKVKALVKHGLCLDKALEGTGINKENFLAMDGHYNARYDSLVIYGDTDSKNLTENLNCEDQVAPEDWVQERQYKRLLHKLLNQLTDVEKNILKHRYELDGYELLSWAELSSKYNLAHRTVQLRRTTGLNKLKELYHET
jgi:RNA polymerase primary sigma factor